MAAGRVYGALAFVLALFCLARKARLEERWMMREFGERYAEYRRRSWALLPWIY
jgi:protein-S-isoprenylcysteine O-methyltransferase Ste14